MSELLGQVERTIERRGLFQDGQPIVVAVSGGLDSMVLLRVLHELAAGHAWQLKAAHLNHQLRGRSSDADARLVARVAAALGLPCVVGRADVRGLARAGGLSLEMAARQARHEFLAREAAALARPTVALAHHADDQLELFFLRLLRGCGGQGLAGMKWRSPSPSNPRVALVRPFLDQPKAALRQWAAARNVPFREDASNARLDIPRNRIRHELLPLLRRHYQPALHRTILRLMDIIGDEAAFAAQAAQEWIAQRGAATPFAELPVAVQRRCIQLQLLAQGLEPDYGLVEQLRTCPNRAVTLGPATLILAERRLVVGLKGSKTHATKTIPAVGSGPLTISRLQVGAPPVSPAPDGFKVRIAAVGPTPMAKSEPLSVPLSQPLSPVRVSRDAQGFVRLVQAKPAFFKPGTLELNLSASAGQVLFEGLRLRWRITPPLVAASRQSAADFGALGPPWRIPRGRTKPAPCRAGLEVFDADRVGTRIVLRHWQPGDRFQPIGLPGLVKLQDLFTNEKFARERRHELIVAATVQGELFWVEGLRMSERFKLHRTTKRRLQWAWRRP